jgi:hypothetical protein
MGGGGEYYYENGGGDYYYDNGSAAGGGESVGDGGASRPYYNGKWLFSEGLSCTCCCHYFMRLTNTLYVKEMKGKAIMVIGTIMNLAEKKASWRTV